MGNVGIKISTFTFDAWAIRSLTFYFLPSAPCNINQNKLQRRNSIWLHRWPIHGLTGAWRETNCRLMRVAKSPSSQLHFIHFANKIVYL